MAEGLSPTAAGQMLTTWKGNYTWVQLHTGAPGANGTANIANETSRQQATWTTTVTTQSMSNTATITWSAVTVSSGTQTYTHVSIWTASTAGTFGGSGTITANPVSNGDTFQLNTGAVTVSLPVAS